MNLKKPLIEVEQLHIDHQGKTLVDLSFHLYEGEVLGVVGPSGSGKSLTAKALAGILPENLQLRFKGSAIPSIGYVFQDPLSALNPLMCIGKQIEEVCKSREETFKLLEWIGFDEPQKRYYQHPFQLSGGMRQRVVIAIALAQKPALLLCDEATSSLDLVTQEHILSLLERIRNERGISILLITHDWSNVLRLCNRVLVIHQGKIVDQGETKHLYKHPKHSLTKALIEACSPF